MFAQQNFFTKAAGESFGFYPRTGGVGFSFLNTQAALQNTSFAEGFNSSIYRGEGRMNAMRMGVGRGREVLGQHYKGFSAARNYSAMRGMGRGIVGSGFNTAQHMFKTSGAQAAARFAGGAAMKALPAIGTAYLMYEGWQSNGVLGAIGGAAESVAYTAGFNAAGAILGSAVLPVAAGAALMGGATYMAMKAGKEHMKGLRNLELGADSLGAIGSQGAATMRQRAAMAMRNTHINGRMALGNEALLFHTRY